MATQLYLLLFCKGGNCREEDSVRPCFGCFNPATDIIIQKCKIVVEAKYQEIFSIVHSSSHKTCKSWLFILWYDLLASEHVDVCLCGHTGVKTNSCGPTVTIAEISGLLGKM